MQGMDYVYAVWQEKSFSAAARKLFVSQPALSASVRKVERELGLPIFNRSTTPLQLTDAGRAYIDAAERIFRIKRDLKSYCDDLAGLESGTLRLGGTNFFASCFLPPMIEAFSSRHPHIALSVTESDSADLFNKLATEELDIIVDSGIYDAALYEAIPFYQDHLLLSVPAFLPINREFSSYLLTQQDIMLGRHLRPDVPAVPLSAFQDTDFLILGKGNDMFRRSRKLFQNNSMTPHVRLYLNVAAGRYHVLGATFLTDTLVRLSAPNEALVYYKLDDPNAQRQIFLALQRRGYRTNAMQGFIKSSLNLYQDAPA